MTVFCVVAPWKPQIVHINIKLTKKLRAGELRKFLLPLLRKPYIKIMLNYITQSRRFWRKKDRQFTGNWATISFEDLKYIKILIYSIRPIIGLLLPEIRCNYKLSYFGTSTHWLTMDKIIQISLVLKLLSMPVQFSRHVFCMIWMNDCSKINIKSWQFMPTTNKVSTDFSFLLVEERAGKRFPLYG